MATTIQYPSLTFNGSGTTPLAGTYIGSVGELTKVASGTMTRPNDTTAYAVNDAVRNSTSTPTATEITGVGRIVGGTGAITKVRVVKSSKTTTNAIFRLWIFSTTPTSPGVDNAPFKLLWANRDLRVGYFDIAMTTEDTTDSDCAEGQVTEVFVPFSLPEDSTSLYAILEAKAAYTPANQEQFYIELTVKQD